MANFDDPSFFEGSIFNFDPTHLAPPPLDGAGPSNLKQHRLSISSASPSDFLSTFSPAPSSSAGFGPPSLHHTSSSNHSPRSSASPPSLLSMSDSELDDLLNFNSSAEESFSLNNLVEEMDQKSVAQPMSMHQQQQQQPPMGFPLFLPNFQMGTMGNANVPAQSQGQGQGQGGFDCAKSQTDQLANMLFQQHLAQQQQQQALSQLQHTMAPEWLRNQNEVLKQQMQYSQPAQNVFNPPNPQTQPVPQTAAPVLAPSSDAVSQSQTTDTSPPDVKPKVKPVGRPPGRRGPKPKDDPSSSAPGGKHNKTERRYREKVQAAQSNLRDSVPALRVLYGTSTDEQRRTTDVKLADGSVDGLGEITRPNASAKTTIFLGARLYIELLQERVASLQRKVVELEDYRSAVGGQEEFEVWKADFERRDREMLEAARRLKRESESDEDAADEDGEEEEEEEPSPPPASKKRKVRKTKEASDDSSSTTSTTAAVRVFAAFAMTFSFLPSAGNTFNSIPTTSSDTILSNPSTSQVISRLPIITAEHATRLLSRGLPGAAVPQPITLVEWTWKILVAVLVAFAIGPIFRRLSRRTEAGVATTVKEAAKYAFRVESPTLPAVIQYAAAIVGGVISPSKTNYWYTILHLNRTAIDAYSLALLALIQPETRFLTSPEKLWKQAQASITESTPSSLVTILNLPLAEAQQCLPLVPPTSQPIEAMADEINLVLLNDLYSRLFAKLVTATTAEGPLPSTTKALCANLINYDIKTELKSTAFDKEIRGTISSVSKGSSSHALGLVLIGLWGVLAGPSPSSQASLATALAAEEMNGHSLSSISAMLNLLYPGFSPSPSSTSTNPLSPNSLALDRLALVCIEYLKLVITSTSDNRVEASKRIGVVSTNLRLALAQTDLRSDAADEGLNMAKERLVGVLSVVGRRAMSRVSGRDSDSGLEAEIDEL